MTTFKNNAKYAELLLSYLDAAVREDTPLTVKEVLSVFVWRFKGGDMVEEAQRTRLKPETSAVTFPDGFSKSIAGEWPHGKQSAALRAILRNRAIAGKLRSRSVLARLSTFQVLVSGYGEPLEELMVYSGMKSVYHIFGMVWEWSSVAVKGVDWRLLEEYSRELLVGCSAVSRMDLPTVEGCRNKYWHMLAGSRVNGLMLAIKQVRGLIALASSRQAMALARSQGQEERKRWGNNVGSGMKGQVRLSDQGLATKFLRHDVGPCVLRVSQQMALLGSGKVRYALGKSDMERLHQVLMSAASALVGVCAQACVGTPLQRAKSSLAVGATERNIGRIVASSRLVAVGDEVLVCKGYRRAYTALLGRLAGPMCREETSQLVQEAVATAACGVLDVEGFLQDAASLDAASALNASKVFKICPAPDVSPGAAMIDRIKTIGDGNEVDGAMILEFEAELRAQILRAFIKGRGERLKLRDENIRPLWLGDYLQGRTDMVPSDEIHEFLAWEGMAEMPDVSMYDPANWKDSGLGADTVREAETVDFLGKRGNMITRLLFDDDCPMPGRLVLSEDHVIKFFIKAEGHKDPARGIFSANLTDRQAQSWMERAVDQVAREHPSYMIGQEVDDREAKVRLLTARNADRTLMALYYSFDISGWSAKMPAEPQRISHKLWGDLYGGHLFRRATAINEGAYIYLNLDGYRGWFENTHSNLEGFNGKEMTMVLVALLSLSVKRWRVAVVERGIMTAQEASKVSALLFAYIDDGLSRIDLPIAYAEVAFEVYKTTVIDTFARCGFSVEVSKCFPSDRFAIFLNEVYLAGRHVVHGVRAAMGISSEPTERHTSLVERVTSVSTGVRGAVMAGLSPLSAVLLMAYHVLMHLVEWVEEKDAVILAGWSLCPRAWGGLGVPSMLQIYVSGSGSAFEESVATMQCYAQLNRSVKKAFLRLCRTPLVERDAVGVLTAPLSGKVADGYMVDSRVAVAVRKALQEKVGTSELSRYANRLLKYADVKAFEGYALAILAFSPHEVMQEQMLTNLADAHPHSVFSGFARRLEKSTTVLNVVGNTRFGQMVETNRVESKISVAVYRSRTV